MNYGGKCMLDHGVESVDVRINKNADDLKLAGILPISARAFCFCNIRFDKSLMKKKNGPPLLEQLDKDLGPSKDLDISHLNIPVLNWSNEEVVSLVVEAAHYFVMMHCKTACSMLQPFKMGRGAFKRTNVHLTQAKHCFY